MAKSISTLLRAPSGPIDLSEFDPRATPGFKKGKSGAKKAQAKHAERLATLQEQLYAEGRKGGARSVLLVLQGMDTSGKGGTVRHVVGQCDPAGVHVASFGRPTPEELRARLPVADPAAAPARRQARRLRPLALRGRARGARAQARRQAHVDPPLRRHQPLRGRARRRAARGSSSASCTSRAEEQRARLLARLDDPTKHWKYNPHDLEDRALWDDYMAAYADALERCSTEAAPWHIVPADRKWYRNWAITQLLCEAARGARPRVARGRLRRRRRAAPSPLGRLESAPMDLDAVEVRVLGCLVEKQRTTPDAYPLSLNALRAACNQSTNRDPVVQYDEATIRDALHRLARRRWTRFASGARGREVPPPARRDARAGAPPEQALLAVLMLRGPQTPGELRAARRPPLLVRRRRARARRSTG